MAGLVTGGVMGAAFGEGFTILHGTVMKVIGQAIMFRSEFEDLRATLDNVESLVTDIRRSNLASDLPEKEIERMDKLMKKGAKMVGKCSKIQQCNFLYKAYYALKLKELNGAIEKFYKFDLQALIAKTALQALVGVNGIQEQMNNLNLDGRMRSGLRSLRTLSVDQNTNIAVETSAKVDQNTNIVFETWGKVDRVLERLDNSDVRMRFGSRTLSVPRPRDDIVGLDLPLKELKQLLSNKKESLLLLTALGGCGKTTLVKMLFWDEDIKGTLSHIKPLAK